MPYNTKGLLTDTVAKPIPQYFNPTADNYEPLYGRNGANWVEIRNRYDAIKSAPVVGVKTVTTTAAEIFAGASRLANRYAMAVYNEGSQPVYWGGSSVTTSNGFPLLPQDSIVFSFDPNVATAIYMIAASNTPVRVVELA